MMKQVIKVAGGLLSIYGGVFLLYLYIQSLNGNGNLIFIGLSLVFFAAGIYLILFFGKVKATNDASILANPDKSQSVIEKNNQLASEWNDINNKKDKLRMLEMSASAAAGDSK